MEYFLISEIILKMFIAITVVVGIVVIMVGIIIELLLIIKIKKNKKGIKYKLKEEETIIKIGCIKQRVEEAEKTQETEEVDQKWIYEEDIWDEEVEELKDNSLLVKLMEEQDDARFYEWIDRYHKHLKRVRNRQALYIKRKAKYGK